MNKAQKLLTLVRGKPVKLKKGQPKELDSLKIIQQLRAKESKLKK